MVASLHLPHANPPVYRRKIVIALSFLSCGPQVAYISAIQQQECLRPSVVSCFPQPSSCRSSHHLKWAEARQRKCSILWRRAGPPATLQQQPSVLNCQKLPPRRKLFTLQQQMHQAGHRYFMQPVTDGLTSLRHVWQPGRTAVHTQQGCRAAATQVLLLAVLYRACDEGNLHVLIGIAS